MVLNYELDWPSRGNCMMKLGDSWGWEVFIVFILTAMWCEQLKVLVVDCGKQNFRQDKVRNNLIMLIVDIFIRGEFMPSWKCWIKLVFMSTINSNESQINFQITAGKKEVKKPFMFIFVHYVNFTNCNKSRW